MAQNSLELKLPSRSSPPFYAKTKNSVIQRKKKMDIKVDYTQLPAGPNLWLTSRIPCPSPLRETSN